MAKKKVKTKGKSAAKPSTASVSDVIADVINNEVIAAAYNSANQSLFVKLCRLCESKDGPFLNIFDADKITAKKIEELMPFGIAENDDLPHKICFRCSAKVEELYEFIQKCIKTQENLRIALGNANPPATKTKTRALWEEKLTKSNISNDDICDALIKKAMEGIKDIPFKILPEEDKKPVHIAPFKRNSKMNVEPLKKEVKNVIPAKIHNDPETCEMLENETPQLPRQTRSSKVDAVNSNASNSAKLNIRNSGGSNSSYTANLSRCAANSNLSIDEKQTTVKQKSINLINKLSFDVDNTNDIDSNKERKKEDSQEQAEKPFNIMDHVSMIKVTGVGILFQCRLCNRNFVKKEVVESHNCAKNGLPKIDFPRIIPTPEPPRVPTVKYIKMATNLKKTVVETNSKSESNKIQTIVDDIKCNEPIKSIPEVKPKPRIGPASRMKKLNHSNPETSQKDSNSNSQESSTSSTSNSEPSVVFPTLPSLNGRYKLVPGPNNTFSLVEEKDSTTVQHSSSTVQHSSSTVQHGSSTVQHSSSTVQPASEEQKNTRKRKISDEPVKSPEVKPYEVSNNKPTDDVDLQRKPYPVGLFQTHTVEPKAFTTPAVKKQSYTIVQTGNPSKLLISTKEQPAVEVPKKKSKKSKPQTSSDSATKEPFTVTLEDVAPPKDPGFFTFINVDPLLQPSYVLPTHNIIQESQISTSTSTVKKALENKDKDKYSCNMCGEAFSREKKLLAHIQSHYNKMDEEDQIRAEKGTKKKGKK